jgi:hypothetical protein
MSAQATVTSPTFGGGLGKWEPDPEVKGQWLAKDGAKRPPARILVRSQVWLGKADDIHYVYRNSEYLGSRPDMKAAQALAKSGERTGEALKDIGLGDAPAFLQLTKAERRASRDAYAETLYDAQGKRIKKKQEDYMVKYDTMSPEQLASEYNKLVDTARAMGLDAYRPVTRFKDKGDALKYIAAVESGIRARQSSEKAVKQEVRKTTGPTPTEVSPPTKVKEVPQMAAKTKTAKKKAAPKKAKANGAAKKVAKTAKAAAGPKVYERPAGKKGEFTAKLGTRPDTNLDKLALFLFSNLGKAFSKEDVCKEVYGKKEAVAAITNVIGNLRNKIEAAKVPYNVKVEENAVGLFAGSGK